MNLLSTFSAMTSLLCLTWPAAARTQSPACALPASEESTKTKVLEAGAALLQDKPPIDALNAYLDGFHFYNGNMKGQMEAHHYCANVNEDLIQCVIYDGNANDAKLMGVEYIVSARLFITLPDSEKAMWHSHVHEVKSGQLIAPGIPESGRTRTHEKAGRHLRQDFPHLAHGYAARTAHRSSADHDGFYRRQSDRSAVGSGSRFTLWDQQRKEEGGSRRTSTRWRRSQAPTRGRWVRSCRLPIPPLRSPLGFPCLVISRNA